MRNRESDTWDRTQTHMVGQGECFGTVPVRCSVQESRVRRMGFFGGNGSYRKKMKPKRKQRQAAEVHSPNSEILVEESLLTPSNDPLPSEEAKIAQANEIAKLKKRVKKLEKRRKSRHVGLRRLKKVGASKQVKSSEKKDSLSAQEDASKQGRNIKDIDQDEKIVFVDVREKTIEKEVSNADPVATAGELVTAASVEDIAAPTTATTADVDDELTLEKTLIAIKPAKPKDQGKAKMIEPEKPLKKKDQIALDEEVERKLEAEMRAKMEEEKRIAREKDKATRAEQLSIKERSKLLAELIESRRKYFAAKRAKEIKNKPPIKAQQRSLICTYMRNMEGFKQKDFKGKSFNDVNKIFDKVYKRVNTFVDMDIENVEEILEKTKAEGSSKRAGQELEKESAKKQKLTEQKQDKVADDDTAELKRCLEIVPENDDDVAIEVTPLSSKSPIIVDYKIYKEGKKSYFKIIRADENLQNYLTFETTFKNFNREDLKVLRSIVKERFKKTNLVDDMENLLFQTLKTMFEPHVEDIIWKYQQGAVKVNNWKLFDACGVYCVTTKIMVYYIMVEKMYLFTNNVLHQLWSV
nr:hypothetical protein [Tanacetum cinerariifolium]